MISVTDRADENAKAWIKRQPGESFVARVYMAGPLEDERRSIVASPGMQHAILLELLGHGHTWSAREDGVLGIYSEAGRRVRVHMISADEAFLLFDVSRLVVVVPSRTDAVAMAAARAWVGEVSKVHAKAGLPTRFYLSTGPKEAALEVGSEREDLCVRDWTWVDSDRG